MLTTIEAEIDADGKVTFLEPLRISKTSRAIITLLNDEKPPKQVNQKPKAVKSDGENRQLEWLKANRDQFAGKYVALDGDILLAHAESLREIREAIKDVSAEDVFIVKVFAEETELSAGL